MNWTDERMPKIIDLGEVIVSLSEFNRVNLGTNGVWAFKAISYLDHNGKAGASAVLAVQPPKAAAAKNTQIMYGPMDKDNTVRHDGKFYKFTPKLPSRPDSSNNSR